MECVESIKLIVEQYIEYFRFRFSKEDTIAPDIVVDDEFNLLRSYYDPKSLNDEQYEVYAEASDPKNKIILVQASAGTGKTHTLLTLTYRLLPTFGGFGQSISAGMKIRPLSVIVIYKHDCLYYFRNTSIRKTAASFFMSNFDLSFYAYKALERQICSSMPYQEYIYIILSLLRSHKKRIVPKDHVLIIDEYTVLPKALLAISLMVCRHLNIPVVICGDQKQLPPINDSHHSAISSYDLVSHFCTNSITFTKNMRCSDVNHSIFLDYISKFSNTTMIHSFGFMLLSLFYGKHIFASSTKHDVFMAARHRENACNVHTIVIRHNIPLEFYYIYVKAGVETSYKERMLDDLYLPNALIFYRDQKIIDKFLPYIPFIIGNKYYYKTFSDQSIVTLRDITYRTDLPDGYIMINTLIVEGSNGNLFEVTRTKCNDVVFNVHLNYLLNPETTSIIDKRAKGKNSNQADDDDMIDEDDDNELAHKSRNRGVKTGYIFNFPVYPVNIMSIHMCQGKTITDPITMDLSHVTYQGLYVALSRIKDSTQIQRISIKDDLNYLVTTILEFPELLKTNSLFDIYDTLEKYEQLEERLYNIGGVYNVLGENNDCTNPDYCRNLASTFFNSDDYNVRLSVYNELKAMSKHWERLIITSPFSYVSLYNPKSSTLHFVLEYEKLIVALSTVQYEFDAALWINEFLKLMVDHPILKDKGRHNRVRYNSQNQLSNYLTNYVPCDADVINHILTRSVIQNEDFDVKKGADSGIYVIETIKRYQAKNIYRTINTEFAAMLYKKLKMQEPITINWLVARLNYMPITQMK